MRSVKKNAIVTISQARELNLAIGKMRERERELRSRLEGKSGVYCPAVELVWGFRTKYTKLL
jgi:hypothetical protein